MFEIMTNGRHGQTFNPTPILGYNFDKAKSTSQPDATTYSGGAITTLGTGGELSGYTKALRLLNVQATLNQVPALTTLGKGDFTFEGWFWFSTVPANYQTIFCLRWPNKGDILIQFGDAGFGYRLQASMGAAFSAANAFSTQQTRSTFLGKWHHLAFVRKDNVCRFYIDGVQQSLASGISTNYNVTSFSGDYDLTGNLSLLLLGSNTSQPTDMYATEFALYNGAKYVANFAPGPGPLVV